MLIKSGLSLEQLQSLQPSLAEWFKHDKISLEDMAKQHTWHIDIPSELPSFSPLQCIEISGFASPARMIAMGLTLKNMRAAFKLPYAAMSLMRYDAKAWLEMGFEMKTHGKEMLDSEFLATFGTSKFNASYLFQQMQLQGCDGTLRDSGGKS